EDALPDDRVHLPDPVHRPDGTRRHHHHPHVPTQIEPAIALRFSRRRGTRTKLHRARVPGADLLRARRKLKVAPLLLLSRRARRTLKLAPLVLLSQGNYNTG